MRCDTKRAIWWDLYKKHISIFCIKHMSAIFRTLQVNEMNATIWYQKLNFAQYYISLYDLLRLYYHAYSSFMHDFISFAL